MGNMLDFFRGSQTGASGKRPNTVSVYSVGPLAKPLGQKPGLQQNSQLPRAVAVYGVAAAVFGVITLYYLFSGMWLTGLIMIVPTFCLSGFAWYYLKISMTRPW